MFGVHGWIHTIMVLGMSILMKEYIDLRKHCTMLIEVQDNNHTLIDLDQEGMVDPTLFDMDFLGGGPAGVSAKTTPPPFTVSLDNHILVSEGSSVTCWGNNHTNRICHFKNLCYLPSHQRFVFFHSEHSLYEGLPKSRFDPTLLDLSSVKDHNMQYFNFIDLPVERVTDFDVDFIHEKSLIFNRFNPDNIMHVIHDDLLPVFQTLRMIAGSVNHTASPFDVQLVFMEGWEPGAYIDLYEPLSLYKPILKQMLDGNQLATCFRDAYVGLTKSTTWYQYGFREPQGPLPNLRVSALEIRQYTNFMKEHLNTDSIEVMDADGKDFIVIFTRRQNRLILNEMDLSLALVKQLKLKVFIVGTESHTIPEMIAILRKASILIGMHGSLLSLAMFLPPKATLIELFPYAVKPDQYTPYKTLTSIPGMGLNYKAWRNMDPKNTKTYPNRAWETGGISHLPKEERERIMNSNEVKPHLCCRDPEWLYRIYQDTVVSVPEVLKLVKDSLHEKNEGGTDHITVQEFVTRRIYPAEVGELKCQGGLENGAQVDPHTTVPSLTVAWEMPWNLKYLKSSDVKYEVWIQESTQSDYTAWILSKRSHTFTGGLKPNTNYNIWVRGILWGDVQGPFNTDNVICST